MSHELWDDTTPTHAERFASAELDAFFDAAPDEPADSEPPPTLASWTRQLPPPLPDQEH